MKPKIQLRNVEASDLVLFFEHQRDPVAVEMVAFRSRDAAEFAQHWATLLADSSKLKKTIVVDGQVVGNIGSWLSDGNGRSGTGSIALSGAAASQPKRFLLFFVWKRPGRFTPVSQSITPPRSASCKNADSFSSASKTGLMRRRQRTFS